MSEGNYESLLKQTWGEIPDKKTLPVGSWRLRGRNASFKEAVDDLSASFMFVYAPVEALDDVSPEGLAELGDDYEVSNNRIFAKFWVETSVDFDAVRKHLAKHGNNVADDLSIEETLKAFKDTEIISYLDVKTYTNRAGEEVEDNDAKSFAPVE